MERVTLWRNKHAYRIKTNEPGPWEVCPDPPDVVVDEVEVREFVPAGELDGIARAYDQSVKAHRRTANDLDRLLKAALPVFSAYRSTEPGRITEEQITEAWAAYDAAKGDSDG